MRTIFILLLASLLLLRAGAQSAMQPSAEATAFYNKAMPVIRPAYKKIVLQTAASLKDRHVNADSVITVLHSHPELGNLADGDIMALCFLVMMEAARSAQEDLKSIMDGVKLINKQKEDLRKTQNEINKLKDNKIDSPVNGKRAVAVNNPDSNSDITEQQQTRLRTITNRYQQAVTTSNNLVEKFRKTQDAIISNLK